MKEKMLGFTAGIFGLGSVTVGFLMLLLLSKYKCFSTTMLFLGVIEASIFLSAYYFKSEKNIEHKTEQYTQSPTTYLQKQISFSDNALNSFFKLKLLYAFLILLATFITSKLNLGNNWNELFYAIIIHLTLAITIDNFGEQYTKTYNQELKQLNLSK
jgi:magnesium-transporting ATPase (P-type)